MLWGVIVSEFSGVVEGRFGEPGAKPSGILGAVSRHWDIVCGKQRRLGVTEQWLARAISRAFLEAAGGVEEDGLMVVRRGKGEAANLDHTAPSYDGRIEAIEQDVGSLKMLLANLRGSIQTQLSEINEAVGKVSSCEVSYTRDSGKVKALEEKVSALELKRGDDEKRISDLFEEVSLLRRNLPPAVVGGASGSPPARARRGRSATAGATDVTTLPTTTQPDDKW